jgi:hypothetical protein
MDWQSKAAGEKDEENLNPFTSEMLTKLQESSRRQMHDLDFLNGALDWIVNQTKVKLTVDERFQGLLKLSIYPKAKLLELNDFSGSYYPAVWEYLDNVRIPEPHVTPHIALPAPETKNAMRDLLTHMRMVNAAMEYTPKHPHSLDPVAYEAERQEVIRRKRKLERDSLMRLHKKYPHCKYDKVMM